MFDQAIFILKDGAVRQGGVTDEALVKEAKRLMGMPAKRKLSAYGPIWACGGAGLTAIAWLICSLL
jgi:hypothetical protein